MFLCKCVCWNECNVFLWELRRWHTKSCGCLQKERTSEARKTHWMTSTNGIYASWKHMKARCDNPKHKEYRYWGWRGIWYDKKRKQFVWFYEDMVSTYKEGLSIDRIDNNWNYCKENCRWATSKQQNHNRNYTKKFRWKPVIEWCRELWIKYHTVMNKIYRWVPIHTALFIK